jgi:2'-phosphotransferase
MIVHGTYFNAWDLIKDTGLKTMARNHVHFAIGMPGDKSVISGMRNTCIKAIINYTFLKRLSFH